MRNLYLNIELCKKDLYDGGTCRGKDECKAYLHEYPNLDVGHEVTVDELADATLRIISFLMQNDAHGLEVDLEKRNKQLAPPMEMTMKEIEDILGYRVKIVSEE